MGSPLTALAAVLAPPPAPAATAPWDEAPGQVGFRFPHDYCSFADIYGAGFLNDELYVIAPTLNPMVGQLPGFAGMLANTTSGLGRRIAELREDAIALDDETSYPYAIFPDDGGLVMWGYTANGDMCFWDTRTGDPDNWGVIVFWNAAGMWECFPKGMIAFLLELVDGSAPHSSRLIGTTHSGNSWRRESMWDADS